MAAMGTTTPIATLAGWLRPPLPLLPEALLGAADEEVAAAEEVVEVAASEMDEDVTTTVVVLLGSVGEAITTYVDVDGGASDDVTGVELDVLVDELDGGSVEEEVDVELVVGGSVDDDEEEELELGGAVEDVGGAAGVEVLV